MRCKLDENLPDSLAEWLRSLGHDAMSVREQGLQGNHDADPYLVCCEERRLLITADKDFSDIYTYPPAPTAGIVLLRIPSQDTASVRTAIERALPVLSSEGMAGAPCVVTEHRIRIHGPD